MLKFLDRKESELIPTDVLVGNFTGENSPTKGILPVKLQVGKKVSKTTLFVIDTYSNYNVLLGRDWIHVNGCVLSSLHQALIFLPIGKDNRNEGMEIAWADDNPFRAETNNIEAGLYTGQLSSIEITKDEIQAEGIGITEMQFEEYIKEGLAQISVQFERPATAQKVRKMLNSVHD